MAASGIRHKLVGVLFILLVVSGLWRDAPALANTASEQEIKAAMIIKFTDFITWPSSSFEDRAAPFTIAIFGEDYLAGLFRPFLGRQFQNRPFAIRQVTELENIGAPQILIVSPSERNRAGKILAQLAGKPVLTIADFPDFAEQGGLINFYRKPSNKIGFKINLEAKEKSGLKISAFLLKIGKAVHLTKGLPVP